MAKSYSAFLKRLISKKNLSGVLDGLAVRLENGFSVKDNDGNILSNFGGDGSGEEARDSNKLIVAEDETIGYIEGSGKDIQLYSDIINYAVEAELSKRNLSSELLSKYKEINLFYDFAETINVRKDFNDMAMSTSSQINELLDNDYISIILKDEYTDELNVVFQFGREIITEKFKLAPEDAVIPETVAASGRAEIVNDFSSDSRFPSGYENAKGSAMWVPLKIQDRVIGVICVLQKTPTVYTSENLKLLTVFSSQVAAFIENERLFHNLRETFMSTVYTLAETIEARDNYTGNHTRRVMDYSLAMGENLGMSSDELETLRLSAVLHDIGKIGISDSVLLKPDRLTFEEFEIIKTHTLVGEKILNNIKQLKHIIPGVKHHHERFDGLGYPEGLSGDEINMTARIIAVADSFDAMTTDRPYRKGMSLKEALEELKRNSGTQFDPSIVDAFIEVSEKITRKWSG